MTDLLWPAYDGPDDLAAIEAVPLADRALPATTYDTVTRAAATWGDRPATSCLTDAAHWQTPSVRTFTGLAEAVHRTANTFTALGVGRRDAVAIISANCESMPRAILGAQAAGIAAPINPSLSAEHVTKLARLACAKVLVVSGPELDPGVWQLGRRIAADTGATALLALRPTAATGPGPTSSPSTVSPSATSTTWPRPPRPAISWPPRQRPRTSPATCTPGGRPACPSWRRTRTATRSPTPG
jgi:fatty-acyl-CoA synthase